MARFLPARARRTLVALAALGGLLLSTAASCATADAATTNCRNGTTKVTTTNLMNYNCAGEPYTTRTPVRACRTTTTSTRHNGSGGVATTTRKRGDYDDGYRNGYDHGYDNGYDNGKHKSKHDDDD